MNDSDLDPLNYAQKPSFMQWAREQPLVPLGTAHKFLPTNANNNNNIESSNLWQNSPI